MPFGNLPTRPFQLIVLGIFIFLAFVGVFLFATFDGFNGGAAKVGTVTIWGLLPSSAMDTQLTALRNVHKEYANVTYEQKSEADFDAQLANAIASDQGPDLILISQEQLLAERSKLSVIPFSIIPQRTYLDTYVPITELFLTDKGTYGLPYAVDPLVLFYNRNTLSSAGVATPPTSWEAVTGLVPRLTQKTGGEVFKSGIALGTYGNIRNARATVSLIFFQSGSTITTLGTNGIRAALVQSNSVTGTGVTPAESGMNFYTQFSDPAKTVYSWNNALPEDRQAFISGDLAMYVGYASEAIILKVSNPNLDFDMAHIPQPSTSNSHITYAKAYAFSIPKVARNPGGARAVALALSSKEQGAQVAKLLSMAPAQRALLTPSATDPYQAIYYPDALIAKGWLSPLTGTTDTIFTAMIGDITSGRSPVDDALQRANQALDAAVQ
ncbi:MAG: hypothetical protein AB203_00035 [Parcubacteria bacterium C7867-008]|nr:MAG: hypothetical protein AB203_00035 [Parcubacteria bacterium C7867-008]